MTLHRFCITLSVLLVSLWIGCNSPDPIEPAYQPNMDPGRLSAIALGQEAVQVASSTGSESSVKAPSTTNAVAGSESRIDVSWKDNSTNETGFEVHRSTAGVNGAFALWVSTGAGVISYSDAGLTPSTQYCYKVRAFRTMGNKTSYSAFSTTACATTRPPPIPTAPSFSDVRPEGSTSILVQWIDNSTTETGFRVERSTDGGATWASAGTTSADIRAIVDFGRASEQQVCYRVIAFNSQGDSSPSNTDCTAPPAGPTNLTASLTSTKEIDLTWTDNSTIEDGYDVFEDDGYGSYTKTASLPANSTGYRFGFRPNFVVIQATKDGGFSDFSNSANAECLDADCPVSCSGYLACPLGTTCDGSICIYHCLDGIQNSGETDVDCGGDACEARCAAGQTCWVNFDCASGSCYYGICQP
jgi:hypothetical protein